MNPFSFPNPDTLAEVVDPICDAFERTWQEGKQPRIEDYLRDVTEPVRSRLLMELLQSDLECRRRRGEEPTYDEYLRRYPDWPEQVQRLFFKSPADSSKTWISSPSEESVGPGQMVGGYEVLEELARGGMGVVYKARQPALNRIVALKMILSGTHARPEERARFHREAEAAARLQHPNIVQIHEIGWEGDLPFLSLEYVDGPSLDQFLAHWHARGRMGLTTVEAAQLVEVLARTIHYAHQNGIIHRDLKPANVLLSGEWRVASGENRDNHLSSLSPLATRHSPLLPKVTDFGLAKFLEGSGDQTRSGTVLGTPHYMAPEQTGIRGGEVGPKADVYALGVILYELVTGRVPFQAATLAETLELVRTAEPIPPIQLQSRLPRDLQTICLKCLHKEAGRRYASAEALAQDLQRFLAGEPIHARPVSVGERAVKWVRRRPVVAGSLAVVVLITTVAFGLVTWQWQLTEQARIDTEAKGAETLIALAQSQWLLENMADARRFLDDCPPKYRTTEWQHLNWVCRAEIASLNGQEIRGEVVFAPDETTILWSTRRSVMMWTGTGEPKPFCEAPGDLLAAPAVSRKEGRLILLSGGKLLNLNPFGKPEEKFIQRIVSIWDWKTQAKLKEWTFDQPFPTANRKVALSPDGRFVIVGGKDLADGKETWAIRDGYNGKTLRAFSGLPPYNLTFSPQGRLLAFSTKEKDDIVIWDLVADRELQRIPSTALVERIAFTLDERQLAHRAPFARSTPWIKVWDLESRQETATWFAQEVEELTFSPDPRYLAYSVDKKLIRVRDLVADRDAVTLRGHTTQIFSLTFSPDGSRLVSTGLGGTIKVWDLQPLAGAGGS